MKEQEAREVILTVKAATRTDRLPDDTVLFWEEMLRPLNAEHATRAAAKGVATWTRFPSWAEFKQAYLLERKLSQPAEIFESPKTRGTPEWVKRWAAARFLHGSFQKAQDMRPFPEQDGHTDPQASRMPAAEWAQEATAVSDSDVWKQVRSL